MNRSFHLPLDHPYEIVSHDDHVQSLERLFAFIPGFIQRRGIIHVGAHEGEEVSHYLSEGFTRIFLIEANPRHIQSLHSRFDKRSGVSIIEGAISDARGRAPFYIHTSRSQSTESASLFPISDLFQRINPTLRTPQTEEVSLMTLDDLVENGDIPRGQANILLLDIQGAELKALSGAKHLLKTLDVVICEMQHIPLYRHANKPSEIYRFLDAFNFVPAYSIHHTLYDARGRFPAWYECLFLKQ